MPCIMQAGSGMEINERLPAPSPSRLSQRCRQVVGCVASGHSVLALDQGDRVHVLLLSAKILLGSVHWRSV